MSVIGKFDVNCYKNPSYRKSQGSIEGITIAIFFGAAGIAAIVGLSPIVLTIHHNTILLFFILNIFCFNILNEN